MRNQILEREKGWVGKKKRAAQITEQLCVQRKGGKESVGNKGINDICFWHKPGTLPLPALPERLGSTLDSPWTHRFFKAAETLWVQAWGSEGFQFPSLSSVWKERRLSDCAQQNGPWWLGGRRGQGEDLGRNQWCRTKENYNLNQQICASKNTFLWLVWIPESNQNITILDFSKFSCTLFSDKYTKYFFSESVLNPIGFGTLIQHCPYIILSILFKSRSN